MNTPDEKETVINLWGTFFRECLRGLSTFVRGSRDLCKAIVPGNENKIVISICKLRNSLRRERLSPRVLRIGLSEIGN